MARRIAIDRPSVTRELHAMLLFDEDQTVRRAKEGPYLPRPPSPFSLDTFHAICSASCRQIIHKIRSERTICNDTITY